MPSKGHRRLSAQVALGLCTTLFGQPLLSASSTSVTLHWDAPLTTLPICGYAIYARGTPGFIGGEGNFVKEVSGSTTTATMPRDSNAQTTVYAILALYPAEGKDCETTAVGERRRSEFSELVFVNDLWIYYKGISPDTDQDGLPDAMEVEFTNSDATNSDSDGDGLSDGFEYALWEQWLELGWAYDWNGNGTNGLNDANSDYAATAAPCSWPEDDEARWPDWDELYVPYGREPDLACQ